MSADTVQEPEPAVPPPESDDVVIWRYVDYPKFVAMLESRALFFTRIAQLGDSFEGSFPASQTPMSRLLELTGVTPPANAQIQLDPGLADIWRVLREWSSVCCWHASVHESAAMWYQYASANAAVAIRSTVGRLKKALGERPQFLDGFGGSDGFRIGMVKYIDFAKERIPVSSLAAQFFRKRKHFDHEHELRVVLIDFPVEPDGHVNPSRHPDDSGREIPVDLTALVKEVVIGAQAPKWYLPLTNKLLARNGLPLKARLSQLAAAPNY